MGLEPRCERDNVEVVGMGGGDWKGAAVNASPLKASIQIVIIFV